LSLAEILEIRSFSILEKEKLALNDLSGLLVESFTSLIRHSNSIKSINLNATGLSSQILIDLVPGMRHAKSLLCFHLAQNPGINSQVKEFWRNRLSIAKKEPALVIDVKR
jgi:hypothetical protein